MANDYPPLEIIKECHVDAWVKSSAGDEASGSNDMPPSLGPAPPQDAQIFVNTLGGKRITLNVSLKDNTLYQIMTAIRNLVGIPVDQQRWAFPQDHTQVCVNPRKLEQELCETLAFHKITHNSELNLVVVQRPAAKCWICEQDLEVAGSGKCGNCMKRLRKGPV